jgi:hypothetical protein
VVGLAIGYSKAIVVDMGFCLQVRARLYAFSTNFHCDEGRNPSHSRVVTAQ